VWWHMPVIPAQFETEEHCWRSFLRMWFTIKRSLYSASLPLWLTVSIPKELGYPRNKQGLKMPPPDFSLWQTTGCKRHPSITIAT
jgi:hypothetical protein